jgi:hypothetical protein
MNRLSPWIFALGLLCAAAAQAQQAAGSRADGRPAGAPGTATPQPYTTPAQPSQVPRRTPHNPPLLRPLPNTPNPAVPLPDRDLPLLEQQRQRNSQPLGPGGKKP